MVRNNCILVTTTKWHELLHLSSSQVEADTKPLLHAHEMIKEGSYKVDIHSLSDEFLLLTFANLYECREKIYIIDSPGQHKKL